MSPTDDGPSIHYRSLVVQRTTDLLGTWVNPQFQLGIVPGNRLNVNEIRVLWLLGSMGSSTSTELLEAGGISAPNLSKAVAKLDASGLIDRVPSPTDGRSHTLHLTPDGRTAAQQIYDVGDTMAAEIFANWDDADVAALSSLLDRFVTDAEAFARGLRARG